MRSTTKTEPHAWDYLVRREFRLILREGSSYGDVMRATGIPETSLTRYAAGTGGLSAGGWCRLAEYLGFAFSPPGRS